MSRKPTLCVYCGSSPGADPAYIAEALGRAIAGRGATLIYGAGDAGLMGATARGTLEAGGEVIGVVPGVLTAHEGTTDERTTLIRTETMHERKKVMFANADAFLVLPGGPGTLDETIETLTWRQLGIHARPLVFVDVNGYWQPLMDLLAHFSGQGFMGKGFHGFYDRAATPEEAVEKAMAGIGG
jgi:uncharacterized protein (TIGR00730 family)